MKEISDRLNEVCEQEWSGDMVICGRLVYLYYDPERFWKCIRPVCRLGD